MKKTFLDKRKTLFYFLVVFAGVTLISIQFFATKRKMERADFSFFPSSQTEKTTEGIKEGGDVIREMYQSAKEEITSSWEIDEEMIEQLEEEEKEKLIKEKNGEEEQQK